MPKLAEIFSNGKQLTAMDFQNNPRKMALDRSSNWVNSIREAHPGPAFSCELTFRMAYPLLLTAVL
jgi:hypothetical protein